MPHILDEAFRARRGFVAGAEAKSGIRKLLLELRHGSVRGQSLAKRHAQLGAIHRAGRGQPGALGQIVADDCDRAHGKALAEAIRFFGDNAADFERNAADLDCVAASNPEPFGRALGQPDRAGRRRADCSAILEAQLANQGVVGINRLERDRCGAVAGARHRLHAGSRCNSTQCGNGLGFLRRRTALPDFGFDIAAQDRAAARCQLALD